MTLKLYFSVLESIRLRIYNDICKVMLMATVQGGDAFMLICDAIHDFDRERPGSSWRYGVSAPSVCS